MPPPPSKYTTQIPFKNPVHTQVLFCFIACFLPYKINKLHKTTYTSADVISRSCHCFCFLWRRKQTILSDTHFQVHHLVSSMVPPTDVHHFFVKHQFIYVDHAQMWTMNDSSVIFVAELKFSLQKSLRIAHSNCCTKWTLKSGVICYFSSTSVLSPWMLILSNHTLDCVCMEWSHALVELCQI